MKRHVCGSGLVLLAVLLCSTLGWPQMTAPGHPIQIRGQVRLPDNRPAPMGTVVSCDLQGGGTLGQVQTDSQGKFQFQAPSAGSYEINVKVYGYLPETQEVDLRLGLGLPPFRTFVMAPRSSRGLFIFRRVNAGTSPATPGALALLARSIDVLDWPAGHQSSLRAAD